MKPWQIFLILARLQLKFCLDQDWESVSLALCCWGFYCSCSVCAVGGWPETATEGEDMYTAVSWLELCPQLHDGRKGWQWSILTLQVLLQLGCESSF